MFLFLLEVLKTQKDSHTVKDRLTVVVLSLDQFTDQWTSYLLGKTVALLESFQELLERSVSDLGEQINLLCNFTCE